MRIILALFLLALWWLPIILIKRIGTPLSDKVRKRSDHNQDLDTRGIFKILFDAAYLEFCDYAEVALILSIPHAILGYALGIVLFPNNYVATVILITVSSIASLIVWIFIDERRKSKDESDKEGE